MATKYKNAYFIGIGGGGGGRYRHERHRQILQVQGTERRRI